jgi:SAM-dependent methyltransferase
MTEEQAFCLADPNGPNVSAAFRAVLGYLRAEPRLSEAFRTGAGVSWDSHHEDVFVGCDAFYRPGYVAELVPNWIPALDGVEQKLLSGARVADVGCGLGSSSVLLAEAYPRSTVVGSDYHAESIELARKKAAEAGVTDRVGFEAVQPAVPAAAGRPTGSTPARSGRRSRGQGEGQGVEVVVDAGDAPGPAHVSRSTASSSFETWLTTLKLAWA